MKQRHRIRNKAPAGAFAFGGKRAAGSQELIGHKGKGGGGGRAPVESPDSLHSTAYARVIDLLGEGEIYGPVHGLDNALRDVYLNGTPVANEDGSLNFTGASIDFRTGTQWQDPLPGFPASESTIGINAELKSGQPWNRLFTNLQASAVRITLAVEGLSQADTKNGDINGYRVEYLIEVNTDGAGYQVVLSTAFDGKTTQRYTRSHRIDLPRARQGWNIRVRRITPNANSNTISDRTVVDTVTEIIDAKLRYPMSAVVGIKIDASQFQSIPTRAYHVRGRIIRVPSNYHTDLRSYDGVWDGTFKLAWTNNPAWVFYDLISNDRYGLGTRVPAGWLDKWGLYQIGRYCDEMVDDGFGGKEPRFTCNVYLQQAADAYRVVQDFASIFRGMAYWANAAVFASADMPGDPVYTFSSANVVEGKFNYVGSALTTRYTVALVSWNDMSEMGRQKVEYVENREGIARYGIQQIEVTGFGCTSRGQAHRIGKWMLLTSNMETRSVTFSVGLDACRVRPGSVIRVADQHLAGRRIGGRIHEGSASKITVDAELGVRPGDRLTVNLPNGLSETRVVAKAVGTGLTADNTVFTVDSTELTADLVGLPGTVLHITVATPFSQAPEADCVWTLESEVLSAQTFRVLSVKRKEGLLAEISAVQHEPGKFDNVDFGTRLDPKPITVVPPSVQPAPTNIRLASRSVIDQGMARHVGVISWDAAPSAVAYQVQWRRDRSDWVEAGRTGALTLELPDIRAGGYIARIRAINVADVSSVWVNSTETQLEGDIAPPPALALLAAKSLVFGIDLRWAFPEGRFTAQRTEIWYSASNDRASAIKLGDYAFPQSAHTLMGLSAGKRFYFWGRIVALNGEIGAWYPGEQGVMGEASWQASEILEYLNGQISRDELAKELVGTIDGLTDGLDETRAAITAEEIKRADEDGALSSRVDTVMATANGAAAGVQETRSALVGVDGQLKATYSIRAQITQGGDIYAAGMSMGAYAQPDGTVQSSVYFLADRLALLNLANGQTTTPFVIQGGQTFINDAVIGTGRITNAMIHSLEAHKINAGFMSADRIDTGSFNAKVANIGQAYIKRAHIIDAQVDTLAIAGNAVTIPVSMTAKGSATVVVNSNVAGPVVVIAYRSGYDGQATDLRIYVNDELMERAAGSHSAWQSGSGEGTMPWVYTSMPLTAMAVGSAIVGNTRIVVDSAGSGNNGATVRVVALMVKR
ncbi:host specificity protein J [Achromobacter sp. DH1f]|uniref:host specificity protein J n=1 Tax=Achromobacter sp. DH1f TaxID=1397275 RepID=UPI0004698FA3|nr:host specificity protein J [Achromobacter sp. DH1f]